MNGPKQGLVAPVIVIGILFAASTATTVAQAQRGNVESVKNPVAQMILQKFNPNPELHVDDNIVVSCDPDLSIKLFTAVELNDVEFTVNNEEGDVLGTVNYDNIYPLWHTAEFKDLSPFPFSGKLSVLMTANTEKGGDVSKTLTIEPNCEEDADIKGVVDKLTILKPSANELASPLPPSNPDVPKLTNKFSVPELILAVPRNAAENNSVATVNVYLGEDDSGYLLGTINKTVETEIVVISPDVSPIEIPQCASRFNLFYDIKVENHETGDFFTASTQSKFIDISVLEKYPQNFADEEETCMVEIEPGLWAEEISVGTGAEAETGDDLKLHYVLKSESGDVVDSSYARNRPFEFKLGAGRVIEGWELGIPGIKEKGKRRLKISPELGYGSQAIRNLPPNSVLISEIELLEVEK